MSDRCKEEYLWLRITVRFQYTAVYWKMHLSAPIFCPKEKVVFSEQDWSFLRTKLSFPSDEIMGLHKWERMAH